MEYKLMSFSAKYTVNLLVYVLEEKLGAAPILNEEQSVVTRNLVLCKGVSLGQRIAQPKDLH